MKLQAPRDERETSGSPSWKVSSWLRRTLLHTSCLTQSAIVAGSAGIDFFDPSAVREANRQVLLSATPEDESAPPRRPR